MNPFAVSRRKVFAMLAAFLFLAMIDNPALKVSEKTVVGTAKDFMIVRYLRLEGTNEQIGEKLAEIAAKRHGVRPATGDPALIKRRLAWQKKNWPEAYDRARGVAAAFGKPLSGGDFDPTSLSYDMDVNPGCSVVFYPGSATRDGHALLSRNYDFPTRSFAELTGRPKPRGARAMTADPYVIEMRPDKGYASLFIASYDLLLGCIDGVNEKGLSVALLADDQAQNPQFSDGIGLSEVRLTRFVLDRCATAAEARRMLKSVPYNYSFTPCHYMICDASGDSFVWEIKPDLSQRFMVEGKGKPQIVTNHLLGMYGSSNLPEGNSFDRYRRLQQEIAKTPKVDFASANAINGCVAVPTEAADAATLWHSVYDLKDRTMKVSFFLGKDGKGGERRSEYKTFRLR